MKKVYLKSYFNKNIGDDIFIKIVLERYPNVKFMLYGDNNYFKQENIIYKKRNIITRIINKCLEMVSNKHINYETFLSYSCDITVILGGSMFIENKQKPFQYLNRKKLYILGINFGPYQTKEYYEYCYKLFSQAKDVCFRDFKSYEQFDNLKNTRYTVDMVLLSNIEKEINAKDENKVLFSIIKCENKFSNEISEKYYNFINQLIKKFKAKGYKIGFISFCEAEGDLDAINKIKLEEDYDDIDVYAYNGDINEALEYISHSKIIVGSRFHANILGILLNKKIIPISYSDKTINELNDVGFSQTIFDIRKINEWNINDINNDYLNFKLPTTYKEHELDFYFKELDKELSGVKKYE